ncbi:hypothetical protein FOA43_004715 [Brettanomyces nanus]|uniref:Uncharacterized protein n=1 Tax=Eeniella nana TaxID=13502 RepID=A0A875RYG1_EENNA|nr:uncharacterized protein FOA43_004715 [Brettanomyces nanus]QPG77307.1 hypothetical protein FOA43_004715 [Brettanomyces nanus]
MENEMVGTEDVSTQNYSYIPRNWSSELIPKQLGLSSDEEEDYNEAALRSTEKLYNSLERVKKTLGNMSTPEYKKTGSYTGSHGFRENLGNASEMQPLLFQLKQLKNYMEMVSADHPRDYFFKRSPLQGLYKTPGSMNKDINYIDNLSQEIKECEDLIEQLRMTRP